MRKDALLLAFLQRVLLLVPALVLGCGVLVVDTAHSATPAQAADIKLPLTRAYEGRFQGEPILVEITVDRYVEVGSDPTKQQPEKPDKPAQYLWDIVITELKIKHRTVERNGIKMLEIKKSERGDVVFWGRNTTLSPTQRPAEYVSIGDIGFLVETEAFSDEEVQFEFSTERSGPALTVFYYNKPINPQVALKLEE